MIASNTKLHLVVFFLAVILHACVAIAPLHAHGAAAPGAAEPNKLPNIGVLGRGYNMLSGNPHGDGLDPGFSSQVIDLTYDEGLETADGRWLIPDSTEVHEVHVCSYDAVTGTVNGSRSYQQSLQGDVKLGGKGSWGPWGGAFTASEESREASKQTMQKGYHFTYSRAVCGVYEAKFQPYTLFNLTDSFRRGVASLATENGTDASTYYTFFSDFGTHFLDGMLMGGRMVYRSVFTHEAWTKMQENGQDISADASVSWGIFSGSFSGSSKEQERVEEQFDAQRQSVHQFYIGGSPFVSQNQGGLAEWAASLADKPMYVAMSPQFVLTEIAELLTKEYFPNDTLIDVRRQRMAEAYESYCENVEGCVTRPSDPKAPPEKLPKPLYESMLTSIGEQSLLLCGGSESESAKDITTECWTMDTTSGKWMPSASLLESVWTGAFISNSNRSMVLRVGGSWIDNGGYFVSTSSAELYSTATQGWTRFPPLNEARNHPAIYWFSGETETILVIGGCDEYYNKVISSAEYYVEGSGTSWKNATNYLGISYERVDGWSLSAMVGPTKGVYLTASRLLLIGSDFSVSQLMKAPLYVDRYHSCMVYNDDHLFVFGTNYLAFRAATSTMSNVKTIHIMQDPKRARIQY